MNYEDLKALDELKEKGSISEEEYQREKERILNDMNRTSGKKPLFGLEEGIYLMLMHVTQFVGFIIPIILWLINKDENRKVDEHGKNIMNAMISYYIYAIVLCITIIGAPLAVLLGLAYAVFIVIATVKAYNGEYWKYPLVIRIIK